MLTATPLTPASIREPMRSSVRRVPFVPTTTVAPRSARSLRQGLQVVSQEGLPPREDQHRVGVHVQNLVEDAQAFVR